MSKPTVTLSTAAFDELHNALVAIKVIPEGTPKPGEHDQLKLGPLLIKRKSS